MLPESHSAIEVLVIDDSGLYRSSAREMLLKLGMSANNIHYAADGKQALERCKEMQFDVVLCDYNLGGTPNGFYLLEQLRTESLLSLSCVLVIITGDGTPDVVRGFSELDPDDYLLKPISYDILKQRLPSLISAKQKLKPVYDAIDEGHLDTAENRVEELTLEFPEVESHARMLNVQIAMLKGDLDLARNRLIHLNSSSKTAHVMLSLVKLAIDKREFQLAQFLLNTYQGKKNAQFYDRNAQLFFLKGEYEKSVQCTLQALSLSSKAASRYQLLSYCYLSQAKTESFIDVHKKWLARTELSLNKNIEVVQLGATVMLDLVEQQDLANLPEQIAAWVTYWRKGFQRNEYQYFEALYVAHVFYLQHRPNQGAEALNKYFSLVKGRESGATQIELVALIKVLLVSGQHKLYLTSYEQLKQRFNLEKEDKMSSMALRAYAAKWTSSKEENTKKYDNGLALSKEFYASKHYTDAVHAIVEALKLMPVSTVDGSIHLLKCINKAWPLGYSKSNVKKLYHLHYGTIIGSDFSRSRECEILIKNIVLQLGS